MMVFLQMINDTTMPSAKIDFRDSNSFRIDKSGKALL